MPRTRSTRPRRNAAGSDASHRRYAVNSASSRAWVGGYIGPMMTISGFMPRLGSADHVLDAIAAVQAGRHVLPVADLAVDEGVMVHLVERRDIGVAHELADLGLDFELGDPGDELLARLAVGDQIGDRDALQ